MTTWFTSDTHFGHANIIRYCRRPFTSVEYMNGHMIREWNNRVQPEDEVWHCGDFAFGKDGEKVTRWVRPLLRGKIHLIRGNHDIFSTDSLFASVKDYEEIAVQGQKIVLFHYGLRTWHHDLRGTWHLFGHSHAALPSHGKSFDVGVDAWNFRPVSFAEIRAKMNTLDIAKGTPTFLCYTCGKFPCRCDD